MAAGQRLSVQTLTHELGDITGEWFQLGLELKVDHSKLKKIEADYTSVERRKSEMLYLWLQNDLYASWHEVVTALSSMGKKAIAQRLLKKYGAPPGKCKQPNIPGSDAFLNTSTKSARRNVGWLCEVHKQDHNLHKEYMQFLFKVIKLLEKKKVSPDDLLFAWSCMTTTSEVPSSLQKTDSIHSIIIAVQSQHAQYFDYCTIGDLAEHFGEEEGTRLVESYENRLKKELSNRFVRNIPRKASKLIVKVDWRRNDTAKQGDFIVTFRNTLSKLFDQRPEEFILKDVREGCLELTFLIPEANVSHFKHTVQERKDDLKQLRVMAISLDEQPLWKQPNHGNQEESDNLPPPTKKMRAVIDAEVFMNGSSASVNPPVVHKHKQRKLVWRSAPQEPVKQQHTACSAPPSRVLTGLLVILIIILVWAGVKERDHSAVIYFCLFLMVVFFIGCSLLPQWRHKRNCIVFRFLLLALLLLAFGMLLYTVEVF